MSELAEESPRRTELAGLAPAILTSLRQAIFAMIGIAFGADRIGMNLLAAGALMIGALVLLLALALVRWWRFTYRVGADDIRVESGLLAREARSIPYDRIQDVSIAEPLLARLLGLAEVKFETGAGGKDEMTLAYVTRAEGERLRGLVRRRRLGAPGPPGQAGEIADDASTPLFVMSLPRVLLFGMFEFSLVVLAVIGTGLQQFDFLLPFDIWDPDWWAGHLAIGSDSLRAFGMAVQVAGIVMAALSLLLLGMVTGVVRTLLREYGFRLDRTERGFRRRRGLLNRTDVVMPEHRVQAAVVKTGLVRQLLGWHSLTFVSLASDAGSSSHAVAPFAQPFEIAPVAKAARMMLPPSDLSWHRPSPQPWLLRGLLLAAVAVAAAGVLALTEPLFAVLPLLAIPLLAAGQWLGWLRHAHAMDRGHVFVRHGLLAPVMCSAPAIKLQSVEIAQGPLAHWLDYATVHFGLAGGTLAMPGVPLAAAKAMRDTVLDDIARVDFSQLARAE